MFNPMTPPELIAALGKVLRTAADSDGRPDDYQRGQLLSASSIARYLAAEQEQAPELLDWFRRELTQLVDDVPPGASATELGELLVSLLERLGDGEAERSFRQRLHRLFAELADREVAALAR